MSTLTSINDLNYNYLSNLISNLLANKLYRCETQMQFEIAWKIKEDLNSLHEWDVCLEYLSSTSVCNNKTKRLYTDIIILNKSTGNFIPIEIKYKTKLYSHGGVEVLKNHGAQDLGSYDFLWDAKRVELLKSPFITIRDNNGNTITYTKEITLTDFIRGFSIMITNDSTYYSGSHIGYAQNFYPIDDKCFSNGTSYNWVGRNPNIKSYFLNTWRDMPIEFDNNHNCNWSTSISSPHPYSVNFKYLIFEI